MYQAARSQRVEVLKCLHLAVHELTNVNSVTLGSSFSLKGRAKPRATRSDHVTLRFRLKLE